MTMESEKLLKAAGMGSVEAFEKLTEDYYKTVYNMILSSCGRQANTAELAQEAFVRVFNNIKSINSVNSLKTTIYKAVRDICIKNKDKVKMIS